MTRQSRRSLPSVDAVLRDERVCALTARFQRPALVNLIRTVLSEIRESGELEDGEGQIDAAGRVVQRSEQLTSGMVPLINGTGTILHTNLGRAPLAAEAIQAMVEAAGVTDLEFDRGSAVRRSRQTHVDGLVNLLLGSEASMVVCNNAAAILLVLAAVCSRRDAIVSRGENVEIGDGFRIPSIVRQSGARLREVGTTNRTTPLDYEEAVTARTGAILRIHTSNFAIVGYTQSVGLEILREMAARHGIRLIVDNGSGALLDTQAFGLPHEPTPEEAIDAGADVVTFSTDKLLGGPQAGIIAGRKDLLNKIRRHPLARAVRPDKTTLAALHATLLLYAAGKAGHIPVVRMLSMSIEEIEGRAQSAVLSLKQRGVMAETEPGESVIGGGALPMGSLRTVVIAVRPAGSARSFAHKLATLPVPLIVRTVGGRILIDLRTVDPRQDLTLIAAISTAACAS